MEGFLERGNHRCEVRGDILLDGLEGVSEEVNNAVHVELRTEQIKERILAVTLYELRYFVEQLVEHRK